MGPASIAYCKGHDRSRALTAAATGGQPRSANLGRFQIFAFGFGSIVGSAWCVLVGIWLGQAGPGGAVLGFVTGGIIVACIASCYAELTARIPQTGGEFAFAKHVFGPLAGFFVGWFVALCWLCILIFEGLAVAWFIERLFPALGDRTLYHAFGSDVTLKQITVGVIGSLLVMTVNFRGTKTSARFQSLLTYLFVAGSVCVATAMIFRGSPANLLPLFPDNSSVRWWSGAALMFANAAFFLTGFQAVSQLVEERSKRISLRSFGRILVASVAAAVSFYCFVILAAGSILPWTDLAGMPLAFIEGAKTLPFGDIVVPLILTVVIMSLLKTWNGVFMMSAKTLIALARAGFLPKSFLGGGKTGESTHRILLGIGAFNIVGLFLGRGAITALVDTITISLVVGYVICCLAVPVLRKREPAAESSYRASNVALVAAIGGSILMAVVAVLSPILRAGTVPPEYLIAPVWLVVGILVFRASRGGQAGAGSTAELEPSIG
ncbi:MAG: APC family permease [Sphingomonadales bacterium]|nr:MAG: APC family permease [Sphingomonadales bacterium]